MSLLTHMISTDTATICVFDLAAMRHRKDDIGDWWSIPKNRVEEHENQNALFIDLGDDGTYPVLVRNALEPDQEGYCLKTPSGTLFVGPGEEMSGGGFEPTGEWGGFFEAIEGAYQRISVRAVDEAIVISVHSTDPFVNRSTDMFRL